MAEGIRELNGFGLLPRIENVAFHRLPPRPPAKGGLAGSMGLMAMDVMPADLAQNEADFEMVGPRLAESSSSRRPSTKALLYRCDSAGHCASDRNFKPFPARLWG